MHALIGIAAVFAAIAGGFLLEKGNLWVLLQPAELLIVGGSALGIVMVANQPEVIGKMWHGWLAAFHPPTRTPQAFLRSLCLLYEVFTFIQRSGVMEFERDVESPKDSRIFANHPEFLKDTATRDFLCDSIRMLVVVVLAREMAQLPNVLVIEGHTDARPFRNASPTEGYSNWELASDRANAARRLLHAYGVRPEQVVEVRGFADQRPFVPADRTDTRNRRVSIVVRFTQEPGA